MTLEEKVSLSLSLFSPFSSWHHDFPIMLSHRQARDVMHHAKPCQTLTTITPHHQIQKFSPLSLTITSFSFTLPSITTQPWQCWLDASSSRLDGMPPPSRKSVDLRQMITIQDNVESDGRISLPWLESLTALFYPSLHLFWERDMSNFCLISMSIQMVVRQLFISPRVALIDGPFGKYCHEWKACIWKK